MFRRLPRSTLTEPLLPSTTLFRSIAHPSRVLCGWNSPRRARRIAEDEGSGSRAGGPGCPVGAGRRQSGEWGRRSSIGGVGAGGVDLPLRRRGRGRRPWRLRRGVTAGGGGGGGVQGDRKRGV